MDYSVEESPILPGCSIYRHGDRLSLYCCDVFEMTVELLGGRCEYLYDRAAIGAIEYEQKGRYADVVQSVLTPTSEGLIESMLFDPSSRPCPPSSTSKDDLVRFYGRRFTVEVLSEKKSSELPEWYSSKAPGLADASYGFYYICSKAISVE